MQYYIYTHMYVFLCICIYLCFKRTKCVCVCACTDLYCMCIEHNEERVHDEYETTMKHVSHWWTCDVTRLRTTTTEPEPESLHRQVDSKSDGFPGNYELLCASSPTGVPPKSNAQTARVLQQCTGAHSCNRCAFDTRCRYDFHHMHKRLTGVAPSSPRVVIAG